MTNLNTENNDADGVFLQALIKLQNYIEKAFELRVFYLDGIFYASAIFSQNDEQTKIDFRNYNESNPNRVIPYECSKRTRQSSKTLLEVFNNKKSPEFIRAFNYLVSSTIMLIWP